MLGLSLAGISFVLYEGPRYAYCYVNGCITRKVTQNVCDALTFLLDKIFIRFATKLYRQVVGISMGTNCVPLVADLFLFCYERDFMKSLSDDKQADVIDALNTTSRYFYEILNIIMFILTIW